MSVTERLCAFRYATSSRDIPWTHLRSVDVAAHRVSAPDLHMMKNLVSLVSDCSLAKATSPETSSTDVYQLLSVLQLTLQFTLWSQSILKEQLTDTQNGAAALQVNSQYVEKLEKKLQTSRQEAIKLREERDNFEITSRGYEHRLAQAESTVRCLKKDLVFERQRVREAMSFMTIQQQQQQCPGLSVSPPFSSFFPAPSQHGKEGIKRDKREENCLRHWHRDCEERHPRSYLSRSCVSSGNTSFVHGHELLTVGTGLCRDKYAILMSEEQTGRKSPSSPPTDKSLARGREMEPPGKFLNERRERAEETHVKNSTATEVVCSSCDKGTMDVSLQRMEAMIQRAERCLDDFRSSLAEEQAQALQSVKGYYAQLKADAQMALESQLATMMERLKAEFMSQEKLTLLRSTLPASSSNDSEEAVCQHCKQRFLTTGLEEHEAKCELRFISCEKCDQAVVARLFARHKCTGAIHSESTTSKNTNSSKPSSLMLQKTQRQLQMLLEEDKEVM